MRTLRIAPVLALACLLLGVGGWMPRALAEETAAVTEEAAAATEEAAAATEETAAATEEAGAAAEETAAVTEETAAEQAAAEQAAAKQAAAEQAAAEQAAAEQAAAEQAAAEQAAKEAAAERLRSLPAELETLSARVGDVSDRLGEMISVAKGKEGPALSGQLEDLHKKAAALDEQTASVAETTTILSAAAEEHFSLWEQELSKLGNESLRKKGEKRRAKVMKTFEHFQGKYAEQAELQKTFSTATKEISDYLKFALTPDGVKEISGEIEKVRKTGGKIRKLLGDAVKDLQSLGPVLQAVAEAQKQ